MPAPVYAAAGIRVRRSLGLAARRSIAHPGRTLRALAAQGQPRDLLAFQAWLDSGRWLGCREARLPDGQRHPLSALLGMPATPPGHAAEIGVLMIVQDEEALIGAALESVRGIADRIVVVDGGSTDGTLGLARAAGAVVIQRPFNDDFAAQRNAGLDHLDTPWVLWLDADEVVDDELCQLLSSAARVSHVDAVLVPRLTFVEGHGAAPLLWPDVDVRLFRRGGRFEGAVHERVVGWRRPLYTPLSGPYVRHQKTALRHYGRAALYRRIDPSTYDDQTFAWIAAEVERLQRERDGGEA